MTPEARGFLAWSALSDSTSAIICELGRSPRGEDWKLLSIPRIPLVVILLTPGHVKLLDDLDNSIGSHLRAVFPIVSKERHVDVLAAVVDRIPNHTKPKPDKPRVGHQDGCEGISVAYLDSEDATPDLWTHREVSSERDTMTIQQQCSISFNIRSVPPRHKIRKIQIPVANTLFLNGKTSTLMAQRWLQRPNYKATGRNTFQILEQQSLPEQVVNMTPVPLPGREPVHLLQTCLRRITGPEIVTASVGNIIQKLSSIDGSGPSPASQQLEEAIHKSIRDQTMESRRPDIWAFVTPKGLDSIDEVNPNASKEGFQSPDEVTRKALEQGCRLHKVLSGGGGWGVKQGLLSIDPESQYGSSRGEVEDKSLSTFPNDKNGDLQLFRNTVNLGDTVTFYINEVPSGPLQGTKVSGGPRKADFALCYHLHFGTTPSTMDSTRVGVEVRLNEGDTTEVVKLGGFFGALSEQGMAFEGQVSHPHTTRVKTKLDAPYISYHVWLGSKLTAWAPGQDTNRAEQSAKDVGLKQQQERLALDVLESRYLSATQAVRETMATLKGDFPNKAVMEWLHARGHEVTVDHVATATPNAPATSPPVRSDKYSNETQPSNQPLVRKYLRNPTTTKTDTQSKQKAPVTSKRLLKGPSSRMPTSSLSSPLYDTPSSDPSRSPSSFETNPSVIQGHPLRDQRLAKEVARQRARREFEFTTHASGLPKAPGDDDDDDDGGAVDTETRLPARSRASPRSQAHDGSEERRGGRGPFEKVRRVLYDPRVADQKIHRNERDFGQ